MHQFVAKLEDGVVIHRRYGESWSHDEAWGLPGTFRIEER